MNEPSALTILGIGEDGVEGLTPRAQAALGQAALVVGGRRHLTLAAGLIRGQTMPWPVPIEQAFPALQASPPAVVLASGDPFCFGIGVTLARAGLPYACIPAPSAFSLACARLGWAAQDVATISFCGRPLAALAPLLQPGRRILALSEGAGTPAAIAEYLRSRGFGPTRLRVLEALGGPGEQIRTFGTDFTGDCHTLNLVALTVAADPGATIIPIATGRPDALFEHDGQMTRREMRALAISALAPRHGELLWDIGCGAGSVAIEWMLCDPANRAIGIERDPARAAQALANADTLGVPAIDIRVALAPAILGKLPPPDAVFVGGGGPAVIAACWDALPPGRRLVAHAVTVETAGALYGMQETCGGSLTRVGIERLDSLGQTRVFRPAMSVTQWAAVKP